MKTCKQSFTIWFNSVCLTLLAVMEGVQAVFPAVRESIPASIYGYSVLTITIANILIRRFMTKVPLGTKDEVAINGSPPS